MATMNDAMRMQRRTLDAVRGATGLTSHETLNLGRQFADVGVSLASGQAIWMVAIQQGAQVGEVFAEARTRGVGFAAALGSIGNMLRPVLALLGPIALAAAAVGSVFSLAARDVNKGADEMGRDLGLTKDQMEALKKSGEDMGVTMGDVFRGVGTTIKEVLAEAFGPQIDQAKSAWSSFLDELGSNTMNELRAIVGTFTGAYGAVVSTWSMLPAAMGDAAYTSARAVIGALQVLIDRSVGAINALREKYNALPEWMRGGQTAPTLSGVQIGMPDNGFAGAMSATGAAGQAGFNAYRAQGEAWVNDTADRTRANAEASRIARLRGAAGEAGGSDARGGRQSDVGGERLTLPSVAAITPLNVAISGLIDPLKLVADEMRLIDGLGRDMASGLSSAFGQTGAAIGELLTTMTGFQSRLADINLAERENRLSAAQADRERSQAQIQSYGDMAAAAKGFFTEGSAGYKAMLAIEQAYRIQQMIGMVQAMTMGGTETAFSIANSAAKGAASMAAGAAKMFEFLGPFAFPAVAAMLGLLAGLGLGGGGGGGGKPSAANDNSPDLTTDAVRASATRDASARGNAAALIASSVEVRVTADREGLNAYVVGTAKREAANIAAPMAVAAASGAKRDTLATLQGQQAGNRRVMV
jgi:hypothetical protein